LYEYLVRLSGELTSLGELDLAEKVRFASRFASGSPSEFLGEARLALTLVSDHCALKLTEKEIIEIKSVIQQINVAFMKIGGG